MHPPAALDLLPPRSVRFVRTEKQKDNFAKFVWDMAKVALTLFGIGPFAKPEGVSLTRLLAGLTIGLALAAGAYMLDGKEWRG